MDDKRAAEAAAASAREPGEAPDLLVARPRRKVLGKFLIGIGAIVLLMRLGEARQPKPPDLAADCDRAAFALSAESVAQARPVTYAIVGPDTKRYVLGVDTAAFVRQPDGGYAAVPLLGREDSVIVAAGVEPMKGCRRTGTFALPIPLGEHQVTLYELTDAGTVEVERKAIEVTAP